MLYWGASEKRGDIIRIRYTLLIMLLTIITILAACSGTEIEAAEAGKKQADEPIEAIALRKETEHFEFYCTEEDEKCLEDLASALEENYERITTDLQAELDFKVKGHIYKDIDTFHEATGMTGAPAWGVGSAFGNGIQMVSPLNPGPKHSRQSLMQVVVHEFTHVVISNITAMPPLWVHEGVAAYEAKQTQVLNGIEQLIRNDKVPSLEVMESYTTPELMEKNKVYPFSYTLVEYVINKYGLESLNAFIRSNSDYKGSFGVDKSEFEQGWNEYLNRSLSRKISAGGLIWKNL